MSWLRILLVTAFLSLSAFAGPNEFSPVERELQPATEARSEFLLAKKPSDQVNPVWTDLTGRPRDLASFQDQFVILNFWASWCAPCQEEMPVLVELQSRHGIYGVQVVGVSVDALEDKADAVAAARSKRVNYPILLGGTTDHMQALGLGVALPATAVLNPQGEVIARFTGLVKPWQIEEVLNRDMLGVASAQPQEPPTDLHAHNDVDHPDDPDHDCAEDAKTTKKRKSSASLVPS